MDAALKWAEGYTHSNAQILICLASAWEHNYSIYKLHRGGHHFGQSLSKPDLFKWLSYYQNHRTLTDECNQYFSQGLPSDLDASFLGPLYGKTKTIPPDGQVGELYSHLLTVDPSEVLPTEKDHIFPLGVMFALFVWMPCMAIYGHYPTELMRKARYGDIETIRKLIRLDRSAIFDPGIAKHLHAWAIDFHNVKLKRIGDTFSEGLPEISKRKIKLVWAQYVYDAAINLGIKLTAPNVRALYDALAQDAGIGLVDPDLAEMTDDAFYRALTRNKKPLTKLSHHK